MRYLVTGHTGFKGSWLTMLLRSRGHEVTGLALDPVDGALFTRLGLASDLACDVRGDVRDAAHVRTAVSEAAPDVIVHMAAQPLVRESLVRPRETVETNVLGTLNVLEAVREAPGVRALLVVTTDKVYANDSPARPRAEGDPLGGDDPYSASKAMADLLTVAWRRSFIGPRAVTARAGNVIGGGDVSRDRLLPDLLSAVSGGHTPLIRYPHAIRPWQHVLDALDGYLTLINAVVESQETPVHPCWNFGPEGHQALTVGQVADRVCALWGEGAAWKQDDSPHPVETHELTLDASRSARELGWHAGLDAEQALAWTVAWAKDVASGADARTATQRQIEEFEKRRSAS